MNSYFDVAYILNFLTFNIFKKYLVKKKIYKHKKSSKNHDPKIYYLKN